MSDDDDASPGDAGPATDGPGASDDGESSPREGGSRERVDGGTQRAIEEFDERAVEMLSWVLDTETRARIYVYLRQHPGSTSEEVAEGTGLYPSTAREALAELAEEDTVTRQKRQSEGAGNNPYEYRAIAPSELVRQTVGQIQEQLNAVCMLDSLREDGDADDAGPVTIRVEPEDQR